MKTSNYFFCIFPHNESKKSNLRILTIKIPSPQWLLWSICKGTTIKLGFYCFKFPKKSACSISSFSSCWSDRFAYKEKTVDGIHTNYEVSSWLLNAYRNISKKKSKISSVRQEFSAAKFVSGGNSENTVRKRPEVLKKVPTL